MRTSFDVGYYLLGVEVFPDTEEIKGSSLIKFKVIEPTDKIQIDLYSQMNIYSIVHNGKSLEYQREHDAVYVSFLESLQKNDFEEIKVHFGGRPLDFDPLTPMFASFLWVKDKNDNPWIQAICQGYGPSGWWPNKDHLSDFPDSASISITNPSDLVAVSNGRLIDIKDLENGKTRSTWHVSYPINNYNITLNIGKYEKNIEFLPSLNGELDVEYHVLNYHVDNVTSKILITEKALSIFEKIFGPYPFPKDGIKFIETPHAMEHQSAVAVGYEFFQNEEAPKSSMPDFAGGELPNQILLHEFAHEWWGNNVRCSDNAELWIHEAFATYAESLFIENEYSYEDALLYLNAMKPDVSNMDPIIGKFGVNHIHYNIWDMYTKGALFLNTIRHIINDDTLWFEIFKEIQKNFKYQSTTTEQIMEFINLKTKTNFRPIFDQHLKFTVIPELELNLKESPNQTILSYRWNADVIEFAMPISYKLEKGSIQWLYPNSEWQEISLGSNPFSEFKLYFDKFYFNTLIKQNE